MAFVQFEFLSKSLMRTVSLTAVLPADYTSFFGSNIPPAKPPYKTLYLMHGIFNNEKDWVLHTNVERFARERGIALVMPSGENHFYTDNPNSTIKYGQFIGEELVDVSRRMFCLSNKREDTFIGGFSMGAYGAIMNGLRYNDTFSKIIALSPAIVSENQLSLIFDNINYDREQFINAVFGKVNLDEEERYNAMKFADSILSETSSIPELYVAVGTEDKFVLDGCREFTSHLKDKNVSLIYEELSGGHDYAFWNETIKKGIEWLPAGEKLI